jgi:hypothetical protein
MKFSTQKSKFKQISDTQNQIDNSLFKSEKQSIELLSNDHYIKLGQIFYDSGWLTALNSPGTIVDNIQISNIEQSAQYGDRVPITIFYELELPVNVSDNYLGYLKPTVYLKPCPEMQLESVMSYKHKLYDATNYWEIKGDGELIYKGYDPPQDVLLTSQINNGDILESHTSKWFAGTVEYTIGADNYRIVGRIIDINTYYDTIYHSPPNQYDYKHFYTQTLDNISGSVITGQGTYQEGTWVNVPPWTLQFTTPLNLTNKTVDVMGVGNTVTVQMRGFKYKNDVLQPGFYHNFTTLGNVYPGTATITSWDFAHENDGFGNNYYKLHYSSNRESQVLISGYDLINLPTIGMYNPGDSLPFTNITLVINPNGYPLVEEDINADMFQSSFQYTWVKDKENPDKHYLFITGQFIVSLPARVDVQTHANHADENYSNDGSDYTLDDENRDDKNVPFYEPDISDVQFKVIVAGINLKDYHNSRVWDKNV